MRFRGRIFVAYHFTPPAADELYARVLMTDDSPLAPPDDRRFCGYESLKWHIWKHCPSRYEWVGFAQYRRRVDFGDRSNDEIDDLASSYDIITNAPGPERNMERQYKSSHIPAHWDALRRVMGSGWDFTAPLMRHGGIGTMRTEVFDRYMAKWEEVFSELSKIITTPDHPYQRRVYGFIAERFFALYFYRLMRERPETKVLFLPVTVGTAH